MRRMAAKFLIALSVMTVINTVIWQYVTADLYDCVDESIPGYLEPGHWVHSWGGHPVVAVPKIAHGRSMSEPDTIKQGWSVTLLLCLWFSFFVVSVLVSLALARVRWSPSKRSNQPIQPTAGRSDA